MATKRKNYSGSDLSQAAKKILKSQINKVKKHLTSIGATNLEFSYGFYYFSGFFTSKTGQIYYLCSYDIRYDSLTKLYYRTAKNYSDFTGGMNQHGDIENLKSLRIY
jgi:hypothetical protein